MKKFKIIALILVVVACLGFYFVRTPEFALLRIAYDINQSGIDGLRPHLTGDAKQAYYVLGFVGSLGEVFGEDGADAIGSEIEKIKWDVENISKNGDHADVDLAFSYDGESAGTINLSMSRSGNSWKIYDFDLPGLDW